MSDDENLPRVLIADDSRIVRATIIKRIRDRFEVREECDGEAAWETLLVDPAIQVVISDLSMPRLDGYGLLSRIRSSKVGRIRQIPVIMISGDEDEASRQHAKDLGATDFIAKGIGTAELLSRLDTLVRLCHTSESLDRAHAELAADTASGLFSRQTFQRRADQALSYASRHNDHVGILMVGLDHYDDLVAGEGMEIAETLLHQFTHMLSHTIRAEDCLCRWQPSWFAIVTPGLDREQTRRFAERLCKSIASAKIQHKDHSLKLTVSIGIANCPFDGHKAADSLFKTAELRMLRGSTDGGNRVVGDGIRGNPEEGYSFDSALTHIAIGDMEPVKPHLAQLGLRLLPLLRSLDQELHLDLPLGELERRLAEAEDKSVFSPNRENQ